jgi:hypothetical protein
LRKCTEDTEESLLERLKKQQQKWADVLSLHEIKSNDDLLRAVEALEATLKTASRCLDTSKFLSIRDAFERVFCLISDHEKKQNDELVSAVKRLKRTLARLENLLSREIEELSHVCDEAREPLPQPIWLNCL